MGGGGVIQIPVGLSTCLLFMLVSISQIFSLYLMYDKFTRVDNEFFEGTDLYHSYPLPPSHTNEFIQGGVHSGLTFKP